MPVFRLVAAAFVLIVAGQLHAQENRPLNFVLILVDDLGWRDLGCQGSPFYETPNIDRLAAQGMRFTDAYAACAVCSPTRAAVMTGRYPGRTGVTDWIRARFQRGNIGTPDRNPTQYVGGKKQRLLCPPNPYWLEKDEVTIAEMLKPLGYISCHIGKWHLGDKAWYPTEQGFDFNFGGCDYGQPPSYFDPFTNKRLQHGIPHLPPKRKGQYLSDREADEAVNFIRTQKDKPFFLYLANYAVHTPIQAKADVTAKYSPKKAQGLKSPAYAAMVESVDDAVGRVTKVLDELKLADNTIVIFTSDNGGLDHNGSPTENSPLRSGKGYAYEGGIRVPLIVRWPGVVRPGTVSSEPVTSVDYLPTIAAISGAKESDRAIDGQSLVGHLRSAGKQRLDRDAIYWHFPHYRHAPGPYSIIRKGSHKLIKFYEGPKFELYDLSKDLGETANLAAAQPKLVQQLDARLMEHLKSIGAKLPRQNPDFAGQPK